MIPGFSNALFPKGHDQESQSKIKRYMTIMDSMTNKELECTNIKLLSDSSRIQRLQRGSGRPGVSRTLIKFHIYKAALHSEGSHSNEMTSDFDFIQ